MEDFYVTRTCMVLLWWQHSSIEGWLGKTIRAASARRLETYTPFEEEYQSRHEKCITEYVACGQSAKA